MFEGLSFYVSGAVSKIDYSDAKEAFDECAKALNEAGASFVFNPTEEIPQDTAHDEAMLICLNELTSRNATTRENVPAYDYLVQLPGWWESEGADLEAVVARAVGIDVVRWQDLQNAIADGEF